MKNMKVKELMRPIEEFSRISSSATLMEAVESLEKVDEEYRAGKVPERILIVINGKGKNVGKISFIDIVKALEPNYKDFVKIKSGINSPLIRTLIDERFMFWHKPLAELWQNACQIKIHDFIKLPTSDQMVNANEKMEEAIHLFVAEGHGFLFVRDGTGIIGLIRLSDVYKKIKMAIESHSSRPAA